MSACVHIIGAGLAGLSAAVRLAGAGRRVALYEAAPQAGGRCRSYFDAELCCRIDNGNHLLLSGNHAALDYLGRIGAVDTMVGPQRPRFDFLDLGDGERWAIMPGTGRLPMWLLRAKGRVPGTRLRDYLGAARLAVAVEDATIAAAMDTRSPAFRRLWQPLAVAALNTETETASARLFGRVLRETFGAGGKALLPLVPALGLSESFVAPALRFLERHGAALQFGARLRAIGFAGASVASLDFEGRRVALVPGDVAILAVPPAVAARLLPDIAAPSEFRAIINAHFRTETRADQPPFVGLVGGTAEWVFRKPGILSVTISAADRLVDEPAESLAPRLWGEVARAYALPAAAPLPAWRIVKEKRATFAATPAQLRRRPPAATGWRNLLLAGDWTDTGLPATIEGAIRSGHKAAALALAAAPPREKS